MKNTKTIFSLMLAFILCALTLQPSLASVHAECGSYAFSVPAGYNAHDYLKCTAFFDLPDEKGVKNGNKMSEDYDANDPSTWISIDDFGDVFEHVLWKEHGGEKRLWRIDIAYLDVVGILDLYGCDRLEYIEATKNRLVSINTGACPNLRELYCDSNWLGAIDVSENPKLKQLWCDDNSLKALDLSVNTELTTLDCNKNALTELDLSAQRGLLELYCADNVLTELDLSHNPLISWLWCPNNRLTALNTSSNTHLKKLYCYGNPLEELDVSGSAELELLDVIGNKLTRLDVSKNKKLKELTAAGNPLVELKLNALLDPGSVTTSGAGSFEYHCSIPYGEGRATAVPASGNAFFGWYASDGAFISSKLTLSFLGASYDDIVAVFTRSGQYIPGDADCSSVVDVSDVLLALRYSLGLIGSDALNLHNANVNNDKRVDIDDVISILRFSLGLQDL